MWASSYYNISDDNTRGKHLCGATTLIRFLKFVKSVHLMLCSIPFATRGTLSASDHVQRSMSFRNFTMYSELCCWKITPQPKHMYCDSRMLVFT